MGVMSIMKNYKELFISFILGSVFILLGACRTLLIKFSANEGTFSHVRFHILLSIVLNEPWSTVIYYVTMCNIIVQV